MAATSIQTEQLQSAFELFNRQSGRLDRSHRLLQTRVETLTRQLQQAQAEHLAEKEQLGKRQARLAAIGEMTAKFAHQVRTPLASAMLHVAQLDRNSPKQQRVVQKITARLNDLGRMVNDMLGFAAESRGSGQLIGVFDLLTDVRQSLESQLDATTDLRVDVDDVTQQVAGNADALKGALLNLVTNAIQACEGNARIVISAERCNEWVRIAVADNGPGIAADVQPRLFEPFFTTRPQGTGLGLAVVQAVAHAHNGDVGVATSAHGARFTIRLPVPAVDGGIGGE